MYHSVFLHHGDPFCTRVLPCQLHSARRFTSMHVSPSPVPCPRSLVGTHFIVRYRFPLQCHAPRRTAAATVGSTRRSTFPPSPPPTHSRPQSRECCSFHRQDFTSGVVATLLFVFASVAAVDLLQNEQNLLEASFPRASERVEEPVLELPNFDLSSRRRQLQCQGPTEVP